MLRSKVRFLKRRVHSPGHYSYEPEFKVEGHPQLGTTLPRVHSAMYLDTKTGRTVKRWFADAMPGHVFKDRHRAAYALASLHIGALTPRVVVQRLVGPSAGRITPEWAERIATVIEQEGDNTWGWSTLHYFKEEITSKSDGVHPIEGSTWIKEFRWNMSGWYVVGHAWHGSGALERYFSARTNKALSALFDEWLAR